MKRLTAFFFVGSIGFAADGSLLIVLIPFLGNYGARCVSFPVAVFVTWVLNRTLTFRDRKSSRFTGEFIRYMGSQFLGAIINLGFYSLCISFSETMREWPIFAFSIGSCAGLVVNYTLAHWIVFRPSVRS